MCVCVRLFLSVSVCVYAHGLADNIPDNTTISRRPISREEEHTTLPLVNSEHVNIKHNQRISVETTLSTYSILLLAWESIFHFFVHDIVVTLLHTCMLFCHSILDPRVWVCALNSGAMLVSLVVVI